MRTNKEAALKAVAEAIEENPGIKGDDCKSSRQFLLGWAGTCFERETKRSMTNKEEEIMIGEITRFLKTDVNKSLRLLDKVLNVFVDADQPLEASTCECCKDKRKLLKELKKAYLVK